MEKDFSVIEEMLGIADDAACFERRGLSFGEWTDKITSEMEDEHERLGEFLHLTYDYACSLYVAGEYDKAREVISAILCKTGVDDYENDIFPADYYEIIVKLEFLITLCLLKCGGDCYGDASNYSAAAALNLLAYDPDNNYARAKANYLSGIAIICCGYRNRSVIKDAKERLEKEAERIQKLIQNIDAYLTEG